MLKKNKKFTLLLSGLAGTLVATSAAGVALSSCSTTSTSKDVEYSYVIDWNDKSIVDRLIIDDNGLVYSDNAMTTVVAVSPKVKLATLKIPSRVKSIMGYSKVVYKNSTTGAIVDTIPDGESEDSYFKTYQSVGAFQGMTTLETIILESGSNLQSIGGIAFSGCTALKTISGLASSLKIIGTYAFNGCTSLTAIDLSNVINVGSYAFNGCTSLTSVDLSSAIYIGDYSFTNCSGLTALGSLENVRTIGWSAFSGATASGSNITLKLTSLISMNESAFANVQGISTVDFSGNTLLTSLVDSVFSASSVTSVDFTGCSKLTSIGERAFQNCTNLETVYLPSNEITSLTTIGWNAFINCTSLTTINVKGEASTATGFVATSKMSVLGSNFLANTTITSVDLSNFSISSSYASSTPLGSSTSLAFIPNLASVTLPANITTLNAGLFYNSGLQSDSGFSLTLPSTVTSIGYESSLNLGNVGSSSTIASNVSAFSKSGVSSVDMSKITSYSTTSGSELNLPNYLFNGATKLTSVVLKAGTTAIGDYAFQDTTALTSITYGATASTPTTTADATNGFTATAELTSVGTGAFYNAFSADSAAVVDLSLMNSTSTTAPVAFSGSNIATLSLPTNITTIAANSFDNMTYLSSLNFGALTSLTSIAAPNFNNNKLTSIDLSNVTGSLSFSGTSSTNKLFTGLPSECVVSLPSTMSSFSGVFLDADGNSVSYSYPNGLSSSLFSVSSGVLSLNTNDQTTNLSSVDASSNTNILSVGPNTFFGKEKLTSVTLPAKGVSAASGNATGLFSTTTSITANESNTASPTAYATASAPFGNNATLTNLNYSNFTAATSPTEGTTAAATLFKTTNATTWAEVAKIMNSLSYKAGVTGSTAANYAPKNMATWTGTETTASSTMNADTVATWTDQSGGTGNTAITQANVSFSNVFTSANSAAAAAPISISATDVNRTIVHNGITWTYKNTGSAITLTATNVNMYKLTYTSGSTSNSFITYFNETTVTANRNTYYVPARKYVSVTLTIATATESTASTTK